MVKEYEVPMVKRAASSKYHTVAHEFLELNDLPLVDTLDALLYEAANKIKAKKYSPTEIPKVIETIEKIFTVTPIEKKGNVFHIHAEEQEKREILHSALGPLAYSAVAEALDLPFVAVKSLYTTVIWNTAKNQYFFQAVGSQTKRMMELLDLLDQPAANSFGVTCEEDNTFKDPGLEKHKALALYYSNLGLAWMEKKENCRAVNCFTKSIGLNPKSAHAYYYRGMAYDKLGDQEKSFDDISMAFELS